MEKGLLPSGVQAAGTAWRGCWDAGGRSTDSHLEIEVLREARACPGKPQGYGSGQQEQPGVPLPASVRGVECSVLGSTSSGHMQGQYPKPGNVPTLLETLRVPSVEGTVGILETFVSESGF